MAGYIDLHLHTNFSDGVATPAELLDMVRQRQLIAFAVADHDNLDGYRAVKGLLTDDDPELIPGVEFSVAHDDLDMHMLAYGFDPDNAELNEAIEKFQENRNRRGEKMVERLNQLGIDLTIEQVQKIAGGAAIGRPHVAQALAAVGAVPSYEASFRTYIGRDKPAYVPKANFVPAETIRIVHRAGGVAVLAHPTIDNTIDHLEMLTGLGLDGVEIYHPSVGKANRDRFKHLAERYRLITTGGSDYHGLEGRYGIVGSEKVPARLLDDLKRRCQSIRNSH